MERIVVDQMTSFLHENNIMSNAQRRFLADHTMGRAFGTMCRLSVVVSLSTVVVCLTFCIVAKRYVLAKNCLKE